MRRTRSPGPLRRMRQPGGYTLLELVITMPLMALLLLGMGSSIMLASRSIPDGKSASSAALQSAAALEQLAMEVAYATSISARTSAMITFVTPDRTGDGNPETIQYQWDGTPGSPLQRRVNGSQPEQLLPSVQQFSLTYDAPLDSGLGVPLLKTISVQLNAPTGATTGIQTTIQTLNRPQLP